MSEIFQLSSGLIDGDLDLGHPENTVQTPVNRITNELTELTNEFAIIESFSHVVINKTDEGLVLFDTSSHATGAKVVDALRGWTNEPIRAMVYTHGHIDHVGGSGFFIEDSKERGHQAPEVVAHTNVAPRMDRYRLTNGYNVIINERQFGAFRSRGYAMTDKGPHLPDNAARPTREYDGSTTLSYGGKDIILYHGYGETDDHTWSWHADTKSICAGDFFIWNFPNCGNPQKVQRFPKEWAAELRKMMALEPEFFYPAHGLAIEGKARIAHVLEVTASTLEKVVEQTLKLMNEGAILNDIIHEVKIPQDVLQKPWMRPMYDEPEFVVNNLWRLYGGWYNGEPDRLKPAPVSKLADEVASLSGGILALVSKAKTLAEEKDFRTACHIIEYAVNAQGSKTEQQAAHTARAEIYQARRDLETSLMAKGIFGSAANASISANQQD